jgi:hypothetical protein
MGVLVLCVSKLLLVLLDRLLADKLVFVDLLLVSRWLLLLLRLLLRLLLLPRLRSDRLFVDLRLPSRFEEEVLFERLLLRTRRGVEGGRAVAALSSEEEEKDAAAFVVRDDRVFREDRFRSPGPLHSCRLTCVVLSRFHQEKGFDRVSSTEDDVAIMALPVLLDDKTVPDFDRLIPLVVVVEVVVAWEEPFRGSNFAFSNDLV